MAFVVVMHLSPTAESNLAEILQEETPLRVKRATDGVEVTGDTVYVIPPGQRLTIRDGRLRSENAEKPHDPSSIDHFFRSLASDQGANAVGIILSGTGTDGTLGLRAIKEAGGATMVQLPEEAEYESMPESALATSPVDLSLSTAELAEKLVAYRDRSGTIQLPKSEDALEEEERSTLAKIFSELYQTTGLDFSNYKRSTVLRRLERRLQLNGAETLKAYLELLQEDADEVKALQKDFLISVTSFFRDPEAFEALEETVIPAIFEDKSAADQVRVWVPGCATGEEAYSIAMLLTEYAEQLEDAAPDIQVFGTEVDEGALAFGRKGVYPKAIEADVSPERINTFFQEDGDFYQINHGLRERVLFAEHNLLEDPPFSNLDLVSCRNLLIYLNQKLQKHAYRLIHYSLRSRGYLFLGRSEALGQTDRLFETLNPTSNILQALDPPKPNAPNAPVASFLHSGISSGSSLAHSVLATDDDEETPTRPQPGPFSLPGGKLPGASLEVETETDARGLHHRALMEEVASVLVADNRKIVHISGSADRYLQFAEGVPTSDLLSSVPNPIQPQLRSALHQALNEGEASYLTGLKLEIDGEPRRLSVSVRPLEEDGARYVHVRFEDLALTSDAELDAAPESDREALLQKELDRTREQLQATAEEYEAATEEMETANEELLSMNEELQSKNEELETSKEELQSVNEELKATNRELKTKIEEVRQSKGALENLMEATEIATLFLDADLRIQRFTPAAADLFDLRNDDLGRPLSDLTRGFEQKDLLGEARQAFREAKSIEREVRRGPDEWFLAKLRPYRTVDGAVTGVVLTLVDISERRRLERELVDTTEKVRRQIGQDLHDILSSDLAALAMKLDNYRTRLEREEVDVDLEALEDGIEQARKAAEQARTLSHALVPVALQEEHLAAALENLCREQEELAGIALTFEGDREERLPHNKETAMHLYRIAHEAIINARRHADADRIRVDLKRTNGGIDMVVQDDGRGLPDDLDEAEGLGMRTMRYRANLIGATLSLESGPDDDGGTTLRCTLPLAEAEAE
jgi:two-component system CheB/CheR fusion protein